MSFETKDLVIPLLVFIHMLSKTTLIVICRIIIGVATINNPL